MAKAAWYKRLYEYLSAYSEDVPTTIVVTPLVRDVTPEPITVVAPVGQVVAIVRKPKKKAIKKVKRTRR